MHADQGPRETLTRLFEAAIAAAQPALCVPPHLPAPEELRGRVIVIGAGKASAAMAQAVEQHWRAQGLERIEGLVVTRYGHALPCARITIVEAAHPVPDAAGEAAAKRMLQLVHGLRAEDFVLCLISGGGSALLPLPLPGLTLADKQAVNRALLASGATIGEMNVVRRHLSAIKGGRLAAACHPARVLALLISDVPGDQPPDIASGPTVADASTCADALAIVQRHGVHLPPAARALLQDGRGESIKPGDARLARAHTRIVATPQRALEAAAAAARQRGYAAHILGDALEGEARELGKALAGIARQVASRAQPFSPPCVLLSGGETTVSLRAQGGKNDDDSHGDKGKGGTGGTRGRGGRNVEYLLAQAIALAGQPRIHALAGDTDGVDGQEEVAGAYIGPDTLARARALGLRPLDELAAHNGHGFFARLGDALVTGPTHTNVNDFRALLIEACAESTVPIEPAAPVTSSTPDASATPAASPTSAASTTTATSPTSAADPTRGPEGASPPWDI